MNEAKEFPRSESFNNESLIYFFKIFWLKKSLIILSVITFGIFGGVFSLFLPDVYKSEVVLSPTSSNSGDLSSLSQYAGIAAMAGFSLPMSSNQDKTSEGLETIRSFSFFKDYIAENDLFFKLMAPKGWDSINDELLIDKGMFDTKNNKWVNTEKFSVNGKPSLQVAHEKFLESLEIKEDKRTNFISISFTHYSPNIAKEFLEFLISDINEKARREDIFTAEQTIKVLEEEFNKVQYLGVKTGISALIKRNIETISIAKSTQQYLMKELSPAYAPEEKHRPQRLLIVFLFSLIGFIVVSIFVLYKEYFLKRKY